MFDSIIQVTMASLPASLICTVLGYYLLRGLTPLRPIKDQWGTWAVAWGGGTLGVVWFGYEALMGSAAAASLVSLLWLGRAAQARR